MTETKKLGVYFGKETASFVEADKTSLQHSFSIPHALFKKLEQINLQEAPEDVKFTAALQKIFREKEITAKV